MDSGNNSFMFMDSTMPHPTESIQCFLGMCLILSTMKRSFKPSKFVIVQPLDSKW
jgi:hypothetical protein